MVKKLCSILMIIMLLLNSSLLTIISTAVEDVSNTEKISMDLSYTQLTNRTQNEITITGVLERDSNEDPLYENPLVTFEFPAEVDKVVINDIKLLYDSELKIGDYTIEKNTEGKNIIKIPLIGKQTKYQTDGIIKGTNIRLSVNLLVKQDIKTTDSSVIMTCIDGIDENKKVSCKKDIKIINTYEIAETSVSADNIEGTKTTINGIDIITKAILGNNELKNGDVIYSNEIVKYEITVSNTREENVENMRIFSNIPEGMTYVEYDKEAFSFWNEKYTGLETGKADPNGVYWQDDTYQYVVDNNLKAKEINIGTLQKGESKTYSYELKVNSTENDKNIENTIEILENENVIYTYKMSNKAMAGELEVRMRQYQSRTEKNEFSYNVIVKNLTNEDKSAVATLNIPDIAEIKSVRGSYGTEISYEQKDGNLIINLSKIPSSLISTGS